MAKGRRMGRVPLLPPDPETEKKYMLAYNSGQLYHHIEQFPPITTETLFERQQPLQVEIGCGTGEFLCAMAQQNPDQFFFGIDASKRATYHSVHLAKQNKLENIRFLFANFQMLYPLMQPHSWSNFYLLFPDPNYAKRYRKHRIFTPKLLDHLSTTLTLEGRITVVTDQEPFFKDMLAIAENDGRFIKAHPEPYLTDFRPITKTRFQRSWERVNRPIFRFELLLRK